MMRKDWKTASRAALIVLAMLVVVLVIEACGKSSTSGYHPVIKPENFVKNIDNPYYRLKPGTTFVFKGTKEGGTQVVEDRVTKDTKVVLGVTCIVVNDRAMDNGTLVEETFDWYAQDKDGNVWYFGEDSKSYKNGKVVDTHGSWQAGVNGAEPGIIMKAKPEVGQAYRQEYYKGNAEDMAKAINLSGSASVPYGSFKDCLVTEDWTSLEPGVLMNKYYAPGVGPVKEDMVKGGSERLELVSISAP